MCDAIFDMEREIPRGSLHRQPDICSVGTYLYSLVSLQAIAAGSQQDRGFCSMFLSFLFFSFPD